MWVIESFTGWVLRFYELAAAGAAPIASEALERIAKLYAIESMIRGRVADERRTIRQQKSKPIIDEVPSGMWLEFGVARSPVT
jgi:transposase